MAKGVQSTAGWTQNSTRHSFMLSFRRAGELVEGTEFKSFKYISIQKKSKIFKSHLPHFWKIIHSCDCISRWEITPPLLSPFPQALDSWAQFCKCCLAGQFLPLLLSHAPELVPITAPSDGLRNEGKKTSGTAWPSLNPIPVKVHRAKLPSKNMVSTSILHSINPWKLKCKTLFTEKVLRVRWFSKEIIQGSSSENSGKWGQISRVNSLMQCSSSQASSGQITAQVTHAQNL